MRDLVVRLTLEVAKLVSLVNFLNLESIENPGGLQMLASATCMLILEREKAVIKKPASYLAPESRATQWICLFSIIENFLLENFKLEKAES